MKTHTPLRFIAVLLALCLVPSSLVADGDTASVQGEAEAELVRPLTITYLRGALQFGSLIVNNRTGPVAVTLDPGEDVDSQPIITSSNPAEVMPFGFFTDPTFTVTGEPDWVVQVGIDSQIVLSLDGGGTPGTEMIVDNFEILVTDVFGQPPAIDDDATKQFIVPADGEAFLEVGGVLTVNPDDQFGAYTGTYNLTVSYL